MESGRNKIRKREERLKMIGRSSKEWKKAIKEIRHK
jgi:hypothetical protein